MEELLNVKELSELLKISPRTLYDWTHISFIPHYKLPKGVRFKASEVEKWLKLRKENGRMKYRFCIDKNNMIKQDSFG